MNQKLSEEINRTQAPQSRNAFLEMSPVLEHDIYISKALEKKLSIVRTEINKRKKLGYLASNGCILHGFQGTGKNVLVKYLANEMKVNSILCITKEMEPGKITATFEEARKRAKTGNNTFIFIDEIDGFGIKEYARFGAGMSKIITLMSELDGVNSAGSFTSNSNGLYYTFAATNFLDNVDERLMRPGRLEELIQVPLPDLNARKSLAEIHRQNKSINPHSFKIPENVVEYLARKSNGFTPADIRSVIKLTCILAEISKNGVIGLESAKEAIDMFEPSIKRGLDFFTEPKVSLKDVAGREVFKQFLGERVKGEESKCFLYGPKGVGKTIIPEALAYENDCNYIFVRGSELQEGIVGEGTKRIKKLFDRARMAAPCIVHLDELKGIVTARETISHKDDETAYLNSLLSNPIPGVHLFVTANNPLEINDTTLSRFEYKVFMDVPDERERQSFFKGYLNGKFNGQTANELALKTENYSFRDLKRIVDIFNTIEQRMGKKDYQVGGVYAQVLSNYIPENRSGNLNWENIRKNIGDSTIIEKYVHNILNGEIK